MLVELTGRTIAERNRFTGTAFNVGRVLGHCAVDHFHDQK
jgi:hypothetical protein